MPNKQLVYKTHCDNNERAATLAKQSRSDCSCLPMCCRCSNEDCCRSL